MLIFIPFIEQYVNFIVSISPSASGTLTGTDAAASILPRQVANAHSVFNITVGILFLPFVTQFARVVFWLLPDKPIEEEMEIDSIF